MSKNSISIEAPLQLVSEVLADLEKYPTWSTGIKSVQVDEKDGSGRPAKTTSSIDAGVMKDKVTLNYDWSKAPAEISFELDEADLLTAMDGKISISGSDDDVKVTYELVVALSLPVPAPMREKTELATIDLFLKQLKEKCEA
jgi:uncharacterized membrane protein